MASHYHSRSTEIIELSSYTEEEKVAIAARHLLPHQAELHALEGSTLSETALQFLIEDTLGNQVFESLNANWLLVS